MSVIKLGPDNIPYILRITPHTKSLGYWTVRIMYEYDCGTNKTFRDADYGGSKKKSLAAAIAFRDKRIKYLKKHYDFKPIFRRFNRSDLDKNMCETDFITKYISNEGYHITRRTYAIVAQLKTTINGKDKRVRSQWAIKKYGRAGAIRLARKWLRTQYRELKIKR